MSGRLAHIFRHPIKSHGREALASVVLSPGASLPWDRHWAIAHEAARLPDDGGWAPCMNFCRGAKAPDLMAIDCSFDAASGRITLTHPDRPAITLDPETEAEQLIDWMRPLIPADRAGPARVYRATGRGLTDTPEPSISILSLASNAALGAAMGLDLSILRWRGNLWIDGWDAWAEEALPGQRVKIGAAVLRVTEQITRCRATTVNPATGRIEGDTLAALTALRGDPVFGLYATVETGGPIAPGDGVEILP
ncbi:MAG: MOSC domain-containing protein [Paracoccaceae bacterium]|nr:MOSC domain-containing protein [Paracoccaceae bacterium]